MRYATIHGVDGDFEVSKVAFGTGSEIKGLSRVERFELFDYFLSQGGTVIDTAPGYCNGTSEQDIGAWMAARGNRDGVRISTKACRTFAGEPSRLTKKDMLEDLDLSLSHLGTDYVDLFWIHNNDPARPVEQIVDDVNDVVATGKIRAVGCSNWTVGRIEAANAYAAAHNMTGFFANQSQWSLARPNPAYAAAYEAVVMDDESYRRYLEHEVAALPSAPSHRGSSPS